MYSLLLTLHIIFASIWVGGHLILSLGFLPIALRKQDPNMIIFFENVYEKIGIPSLLGQIITGILLFYQMDPEGNFLYWTTFTGKHFYFKIIFLILTLGLAIHARFRIVPNLNKKNILILGYHIIGVTLLSIGFVIVGVHFRLRFLF